ncbi:MAG: nitrate/sulfonate/bicarbonate ABC transporter periplasmic [Planctomycetota bacterium]|nr:MAG: nitrate/sulfonate/bicarbonate ABC transporter periplasmic [Planctomycetota bacterium]
MEGRSRSVAKRLAREILPALVALLCLMTGCSGGGGEPKEEPVVSSETEKPKTPQSAEAPDYSGVTTVREYSYVPAARLPQVKEGAVAGYKWDATKKTIKFPINVWIGWLPLIAANHGHKPNEDSVFFKKHGFKVELVLVDDPVAARDGYVAGDWPVLWCTLDMLVIFSESLMKDARTAPRVFQQISWSNGGDGVVVRDSIKTVKDLKGKTIAYAQNSPSQYYINALLLYGGLSPADVLHKYTSTAFEASAAFVNDPKIDACVSWAPDIYNIAERVKGTHLLSTTADANRLIADVWAARADFARDHPEIIRGLVEGIFEGVHEAKLKNADALKWTADLYGMKAGDVEKMCGDAHFTNFAENQQFLLNLNNPTNFETTWNSARYVYRKLGLVDNPSNFDQVMDFSVLLDIRKDALFKNDVDENKSPLVKKTNDDVILVNTIRINFFPNSDNLYEKARDEYGNVLEDKLYDPLVKESIKKVAELAAKFGGSRVRIVGHTDSSMKGKVDASMVTELSKRRAAAVKNELVKTWGFDESKFEVEGKGWAEPADTENPGDQIKNRRVEIVILGGGGK